MASSLAVLNDAQLHSMEARIVSTLEDRLQALLDSRLPHRPASPLGDDLVVNLGRSLGLAPREEVGVRHARFERAADDEVEDVAVPPDGRVDAVPLGAQEPVDADSDLVDSVEKNMSSYGSYKAHCRTVEWRSTRNRNECLALAQLLDALARGQITLAKNIAIRRYAGVHLADHYGQRWEVCSALMGSSADDSLLPRKTVVKALKDASLFSRLQSNKGAALSARRKVSKEDERPSSAKAKSPFRSSSTKKGGAAKSSSDASAAPKE